MPVALSYQDYGDDGGKPAIVVLHGLFGSARNWMLIAKRLAATHRVFAVDLRNHGNSPWADSMSYPEMAEDLRLFLEAHGLDRPVVIGHSAGGKAAMYLALEHGELIDGLIVIDIAPVAYDHSFLPLVEAMRGVDLAGLRRRAEVEERLAERIPEADMRLFLLQNLVPRDGGGLEWRINLDAIGANMGAITGWPAPAGHHVFTGPTLFIGGDRSDYLQLYHLDIIGEMFPAAEIALIPNAGHRVHAENPDAFLDKVYEFLEGGTV